MKRTPEERKTKTVPHLLERHKPEIIEQLGAKAFELLTPRQARDELGVNSTRIPDLVRQGWLEPAPAEYNVGPAHLYFRWRVEFAKRHRRKYRKSA